jgi:hypothetical protein
MMSQYGRPACCAALIGLTVYVAGNVAAPAQSGTTRNVSLIQQDQSDCTNTTVKDDPIRTRGGEISVTRNSNGSTTVKVAMTVTPDSTYHFFLKCVRQLGDIKTDDEGTGEATFSFQTSEAGATFAFDMYPEGAPSGNKFQSLTVSF